MVSSSTLYPQPAVEVVRQNQLNRIVTEHEWRCPDVARTPARHQSDILVSRWTRDDAQCLEVTNPGNPELHCIAMNLKCMSLTFVHGGRALVRGRLTSGAFQVTAPNVSCSATFESASDVLHLFVSHQTLGECFEDIFGRPHAGDIHIDDPRLVRDPALERLGQALVVSQSDDAALGKLFTESVSLAIVSRLVARHFTLCGQQDRDASALPSWRLSRAIEFIEAHLSDPIGLADIANSTGLTRMHFASQFRRTTGVSPHEYLLRRRIEHAQKLLRETGHNLLEVALSCGFRSHAHFSSVFKRLVGETPFSWRTRMRVDR